MSNLLDLVKQSQLRANIPVMHPGDTVRVHTRIVEGNKERIQVFEGVIIRIHRGQNASTVTVRKISGTIGVERTFLIHSPRIDKFEVTRRGRVRRAKLYYLRERQGKSARIKELRTPRALRALQDAQRSPLSVTTPLPVAAAEAPVEPVAGEATLEPEAAVESAAASGSTGAHE